MTTSSPLSVTIPTPIPQLPQAPRLAGVYNVRTSLSPAAPVCILHRCSLFLASTHPTSTSAQYGSRVFPLVYTRPLPYRVQRHVIILVASGNPPRTPLYDERRMVPRARTRGRFGSTHYSAKSSLLHPHVKYPNPICVFTSTSSERAQQPRSPHTAHTRTPRLFDSNPAKELLRDRSNRPNGGPTPLSLAV